MFFAAAVLLSACGRSPALPPLPTGPQTLTGVVLPSPVSLDRRGTHILRVEGEGKAFLESPRIHIVPFEGRTVGVTGHFERNIDPLDLPVLIVDRVYTTKNDAKMTSLDAAGLSVRAPTGWVASQESGTLLFHLTGSTVAILSISLERTGGAPAIGQPVSVGRESGIRTIDEKTGAQTITLLRADRRVVFLFTPKGSREQMEDLRQGFLSLLASVSFSTQSSSSSKTSSLPLTGSGAGSGRPCGGAAGILCPTSEYCEVTDRATSIGICRKLR